MTRFRIEKGRCRFEVWFKVVILTALALYITPAYTQTLNPHPRIWLTSQLMSNLSAKVSASDPDWLSLKAAADAILKEPLPQLTITGATNSNPVQFTTQETLPWNGTVSTIYLAGGTGAWAAVVNNPSINPWAATATGTNTFTIPVDSTAFGAFSGQQLTFFMAGSENSSATAYLSYGQTGAGWYDAFLQLGLVYKLTGVQTYATKALSLLDWINTLGAAGMISPVSQDSGRASMGATLGLAIAYDWFYDLLSPAEKAATAVTLNLWNNWTINNAYAVHDPTSNYWEAHVTATLATGYATYGDNASAQSWIDWSNNTWTTDFDPKVFNPPSTTIAAANNPIGYFYGGLAVIGFNYGGNDISRHVKRMLMVKSATGVDVFSTNDYAQRWARNLIYQLKPDRWKSTNFGMWTADWYGVMTYSEALLLSAALEGKTEGGWAQWMYMNPGPIPPAGAIFPTPTYQDRLMFANASRAAIDYRQTQPTYFFSDGGEANVYWRSDWTDTADYAFFQATGAHYTGSTPKYSAHVDLTRGTDYLLVQSNFWKGTGDGTNGNPQLDWMSAAYANTLYFWDGGSVAGANCFNQDYAYDGCQTGFGIYKSPIVNLTANYAFAQNEFATAYDYNQNPAKRTLQYFFRSFIAMGNGTYVVWDRIQSTSSTHTKQIRWQFSSASMPVVSNQTIASTVGSSRITAVTLLPPSASIALVRNVNESGSATNWHAEVTDPAPATTYTGLTVLNAGAATSSAPAVTMLGTIDTTFAGVQVATTSPSVVILPRGVVPNGDGTFSSASSAGVTFTTSHSGVGNYLVAGLAAGTYSITLNGTALPGFTAVQVDNTGVLYFSATAGSFAVTQTGGSTPPSVSTFTCNPTTVVSGSAATCTITLTVAAPAGGVSLSLASNSAALSVPPSLAIAAGTTTGSFSAAAGTVTTAQTVTVNATLGSAVSSTSLNVVPATAPGISSLQCSPTSVAAAQSTSCTVTLTSAAPAGGATVSLSVSSAALSAPTSVSITAGTTAASFGATGTTVSSTQTVILTASYNGSSQTFTVTVQGTQTGGTYTCTNNEFVMNADITLANGDAVDLVGTAAAHCAVKGNNHRFIVADYSWTGHFHLQYADVTDVGTSTLDILGGTTPDDWAYIGGSGYVDIEDSTFSRSSGFTIYPVGSAYIVFSRNVYKSDNLVSTDPSAVLARPMFKEWGTSTATKYFQGNRIYMAWIDVGSPNWVIGAAKGCSTTCDADGNIMIGQRVGLAIRGAGSYVSYNYTHGNLDLTPNSPTWSQVYNLSAVGAGVIVENNIFRTGDWVANGIDGELRDNILLELDPHDFARIGNGGLIHHNILLTLYPGLDRYTSTARLSSGDAAFGLEQTGNNLSIYNNTVDARGSAVKSVLWVINGATLNSYRNNVAYRLSLLATYCPTSGDCTSAVGLSDTEGYVTPPPSRALYLDYNSFFYDSTSLRQVNYDIGVSGLTMCQAGWGGHDVGGCPNVSVDPKLRGPLPIGSGQTGFGSSNDSGFPFNDADILSGVYPVSGILSYFRWVYAPGTGSPLIGSQDPQDGPGDIGAVQTSMLPPSAPAIVTTNKRPMVYAGPSFSITDTTVTAKLSGYAADDGLPSNSLTLQWTVVSGPGTVVFGNPAQANTTASFSVNGTYTLRLTASDGALTSTSDAQITVGSVTPSCDLNGDGVVNIQDVTISINMALGVTPFSPAADLNGDGKIDIIDTQRVINASLGSPCKIGP
jgi:hypothetical protein